MTTIPQRLHEIAEQLAVIASSNRGIGLDQAVIVAAIAAELEAPAADAVPVVAYEFEHTRGHRTLHPAAEVGIAYRDTAKAVHALVKQRDHIATVSALQQQLGECSGGYETMEREVAALQARIKDLEAENFTLAAGQCVVTGGLCGDEGGSQHCSLQRAASNVLPSP